MARIEPIPQGLLIEIMKKVTPPDLIQVCQISQKFYDVCSKKSFMKFKLDRDYPNYVKHNNQTDKDLYFMLARPSFLTAELPVINPQTHEVSLGKFTIKFLTHAVYLDFRKRYFNSKLQAVILKAMVVKYPNFKTIDDDEPLIDYSDEFRGDFPPDVLVVNDETYYVTTVNVDTPRQINNYIAEDTEYQKDKVGFESLSDRAIISYLETTFNINTIKPNDKNLIPDYIVYRKLFGHITAVKLGR